ncbi:VanZ family protein [Evansella tamaricis]|uniref:VanZ family protein n=1 Tax=Evansella tamaricis TaxID=2069301 RepID=UPI001FE6BCCD|nr:VanZ family protein [Evansella tamaricis]
MKYTKSQSNRLNKSKQISQTNHSSHSNHPNHNSPYSPYNQNNHSKHQNHFNTRFLFLYIVPLAAWMGMIHFSSSQPYETQNVQPIIREINLQWVTNWFSWVSFQYGDTLVSLETRSPEAFLEFFIRKGAHLFVFAVLGILAYRVINYLLSKTKTSALLSWLFVTGYAAVDEFRQLLHPNRTGLTEDVILDSIGGAIGITAFLILRKKDRFNVHIP